tara:strand:+ start:1502 stop:1828 length:327 start_codon:yes stop_codon:yes gene_type:complete
MAYLDIEAIRKAYPDATLVDEDKGAFKADGTQITLVQSDIDAARTTLNTEAAAVKYKTDRTTDGSTTYAPTGEQLGMLYDDIIAGKLDATGSFAIHNKAVKDANPKPS